MAGASAALLPASAYAKEHRLIQSPLLYPLQGRCMARLQIMRMQRHVHSSLPSAGSHLVAVWISLHAQMQAAAALQQPTMVARGLRPVGRPRPCSILRAGRLAAVGRPARVARVQHKAVASAEALEVRIGGSRACQQCSAACACCQTGSRGLQAPGPRPCHSLLAAARAPPRLAALLPV